MTTLSVTDTHTHTHTHTYIHIYIYIYMYIYIYIKQPPHFKTPPHATGIYIYIYSVYSGYGSDVDYQVEYVNFMLQHL